MLGLSDFHESQECRDTLLPHPPGLKGNEKLN